MRKILLATSALVAFAGAAQAAESPITVTAGGYVDFRAAMFHESQKMTTSERRSGDFNTVYGLNFAATGKAAGGIEYGAMIALNNRYGLNATSLTNEIKESQAYVWMSGNFGKTILGDEKGASALFVYAPTVGEGQIDGDYTYFTDPATLAQFQPAFIDMTENSTKATYLTPKVGNADHKVQLGVSYTPNYGAKGNDVAKYKTNIGSYRDVVETAISYTGNFAPVSVVVTPMMVFAEGGDSDLRDATVWGLGAQAMYAGFTLGGSYVDGGHYGVDKDEGKVKEQNAWTMGLKYTFDKVALAANYMHAKGYATIDSSTGGTVPAGTFQYVEDFSAVGLGATYTWFPGLTSAADAVFFDQDPQAGVNNKGHVLMLSQKMAF